MLRPRIIPCLLIKNGGLAKTINFGNQKYVGDPINAVKIFNEKEVDELIVLDIGATVLGKTPNYILIENLANECRMPLCYGGGVKTVEQVEKIISLGVEKVSLSSAVLDTPELITEAAERVGSQSIVVALDYKKTGIRRRYEILTHNGLRKTGFNPVEFARKVEELGAGELLVNSIEKDGVMTGYDLDLATQVREVINIPLTVLGGAKSLESIEDLIHRFGIIGAAAGSLFVFKGKYRAVLINYPDRTTKESITRKMCKY